LRGAAVPEATSFWSSRRCGRALAAVAAAVTIGLLVDACGGGSKAGATKEAGHGSSAKAAPSDVRISIAPASGRSDRRPDHGITVRATGGTLSKVIVRTKGDRVTGTFNAARTVWRSKWALNVSQHYTVIATGTNPAGRAVTRRSSFSTFTPKATFETRIVEGFGQTYGVGIPIVLYFSAPIKNKAAVERSLDVRTSKRVTGSWFWDGTCNMAPECLYFRPRHYWPTHTRVSFTGHLDGIQVAPGVWGHHTLTQSFTIGSKLTVLVNTARHDMNVYRDGKLFAHWPISSGRPGDDTPNGNYLTIEKSNPVDMVGPGYNIEVPWSVRFTWSGDYLHDAYWSVGEQGFTNVSHGCVNMSPADAETYYNMAVPGDPVTITGSPRAGTWDNGWTMWFLPWSRWVHGSALHKAVRTGPHGSTFVSLHRAREHSPKPKRR
jgi:lipoprotein-anchoring transpeptidase ErfK/SrfK